MTPKSSSFPCVVGAVMPLDGEGPLPLLEAVLSRAEASSPVTKKACIRSFCAAPAPPPDQVTVMVAPLASGAARPCVEQRVVSICEVIALTSVV
jgi:hypothetical protein